MRTTFLLGGVMLLTLVFVQHTPAATAAMHVQAQGKPLRVVTKVLEPFVVKEGDRLTGYSVELWETIAQELQLNYQWVEVQSVNEQLQAVREGSADVAIAGITMTSERERLVDFTHAYFDAGLQIMVVAYPEHSLGATMGLLFTSGLFQILGICFLAALVMAHGIWLVERRTNPDFPRAYLPGVWEGGWWLLNIVGNGEYRDRETKNVLKRTMTIIWWIVGVTLIAQFTATVTSALTVERLTSNIGGIGDLPGKRIATVRGTSSASYLTRHKLPFVAVDRIDEAYDLLFQKKANAIVYDSPVLLYYANHEGRGRVQVVGPIFEPEKYGIALPQGSPLRKPINEVLLNLYQDGTIEAIYQRWFGSR